MENPERAAVKTRMAAVKGLVRNRTGREGKIAFRGYKKIIDFKSPVYNSSWARRVLSIHLRSHSLFLFSLTMTDYNIAAGPPHAVVAILHEGGCQVQRAGFTRV